MHYSSSRAYTCVYGNAGEHTKVARVQMLVIVLNEPLQVCVGVLISLALHAIGYHALSQAVFSKLLFGALLASNRAHSQVMPRVCLQFGALVMQLSLAVYKETSLE
jgi:hypothetical protein